jgi:hypothetical protein
MIRVTLSLERQQSIWLNIESDVMNVERISVHNVMLNPTILVRLAIKILLDHVDSVVMNYRNPRPVWNLLLEMFAENLIVLV